MKKAATSTTRTSRKRKQRAIFPTSHRRDSYSTCIKSLTSKIPSNGEISEDDIDNDFSDLDGEVVTEQKDDDETEKDKYETKWSVQRDEILVNDFTQPTGPTKTLRSNKA